MKIEIIKNHEGLKKDTVIDNCDSSAASDLIGRGIAKVYEAKKVNKKK